MIKLKNKINKMIKKWVIKKWGPKLETK